jgi:hypothetical protein
MPGSQTPQGQDGTCDVAPSRFAFRHMNSVGTLDQQFFVAQWLACPRPCQRFALCLAAPDA